MSAEEPRTFDDFLASLPPEEQQAIAQETDRLCRVALEELLAHLSDADIAALWLLIFAWADGRSTERRTLMADDDDLSDTDYASIYGDEALNARHKAADRATIAMMQQLEAKLQAQADLLEARTAQEKK